MTLRWWKVSGRNLSRHRRRTVLTGTIVVVGFVAVTMTAGFVSQTFRALGDATLRGIGGHLRVLDPAAVGKTSDEQASLLLSGWTELDAILRKDPRVVQTMPKLSFFGLVTKGEKSAAYLGTGTIPERERKVSLVPDAIVAGAFFANPEADEVMLGGGLARALGVGIGELVTVMTTTPDGSLNAVDATVVAVMAYPIKEIDDRVLYMPYAPAARLLKSEGMCHRLVVLLRGGNDVEAAAREATSRLTAAGRPVLVQTWLQTENAVFYKQVRTLYVAVFFFVGLVLSTVVVLATANTMTMSVFERTREIGTLLAIGMERADVRRLFLYEGLLLGIGGSLLGAVASLLLRAALNASGIELPPPPGATKGHLLHVDFIPLAYATGFLVMTLTLLVASWWPARRAARLDPVAALAHV